LPVDETNPTLDNKYVKCLPDPHTIGTPMTKYASWTSSPHQEPNTNPWPGPRGRPNSRDNHISSIKKKGGGHVTYAVGRQEDTPKALTAKRAAWELAEDELAGGNPEQKRANLQVYTTTFKPGRQLQSDPNITLVFATGPAPNAMARLGSRRRRRRILVDPSRLGPLAW